MKTISLLPADVYTVVNKTILTDEDHENLISLYQPIIGPFAISLYLTLWHDINLCKYMSKDLTHYHLMTVLKSNLDMIKKGRECLEAVGLLKSFYKNSTINEYIYEMYSPLPAKEFFLHPILNVVLYNNIGKREYEELKSTYKKIPINMSEYVDISKNLNETYKSSVGDIFKDDNQITEKKYQKNNLSNFIDFDLLISSMPKGIINEKTFTKRIKELINQLAFIYNIDSLKMTELLRLVINEKSAIDSNELIKQVRKFYQYENNGSLPTLIYRAQPEYLKTPAGDDSNRGKMIMVFENTSPYDFLKSKYKGVKPTSRDLKILEYLIIELELKPAVVNVLVDYVLKRNNNKLTQAFVETIAGQWKRLGLETASEAMATAEKEHKKYSKKTITKNVDTPVWFDKNIKSEEMKEEELAELEKMFEDVK